MRDALLATTSIEGLQPLGSAPQRSYELISGTLKQKLGPDAAALFAEPVASEAGDRIDWYAPGGGAAVPLPDLPQAQQEALRARLGTLVGEIRQQAHTLGESGTPEDQRLSEALINAIEVPDEAMIYGVKGAGSDMRPVLVHWAWVRNEQAAVRGILTGMVPRATPLVSAQEPDKGHSPLWWWLILLGWLLLAALLGAILYLLIAPCGVNRFGPVFCPAEQVGQPDAFEDERIISDEIARLQHELSLADRACQPRIPILPLTPETPKEPVKPPVTPEPEKDETKTEADREEVEERIAERGAELGALNFVLEWASLDDIDLYVTCPAGETISYSNREGCGGRYDLDANVAQVSAVNDPAENIVFENAAKGLYKVRAHLRGNRTDGDKPVTLHVLRKDGPSQSYKGIIGPGQDEWTVNISISR